MMNQPPSAAIVSRIRKLLALSGSPNEHEAALALQRAHELMQKHNLEAAELEALGKADAPDIVKEALEVGSSFVWKKRLVAAVGKVNYCMPLISAKRLYLIGRPDNVAAARATTEWLIQTIERLAIVARASGLIESGKTAKNNYVNGVVSRIGQRLADIRRATESQETSSTALVLVREQEVTDFLDIHHPRRKNVTPRASGYFDRDAYRAGLADGDRVSLTPQREIGARRAIPGAGPR